MRLLAPLFALLLGATLSSAQQAPAPAPQGKCVVEGTVLKVADGQPLKRARVMIRPAEGRATPSLAITDAQGHFVLRDLEPGRYRLSVERTGYVRQEYGQRLPNRPGTALTLAPGQKVRDLMFRMFAAAAITGHVYDEEGEPVQGVSVQALRQTYVRGRRDLIVNGAAATNDLGEYRIFGLAPGRYFLSASPAVQMIPGERGPESSAETTGEQVYTATFYPGTVDVGRATPLELNAGEELGRTDLTLVPQRAVRVRGRVVNFLATQSRAGVQVFLTPRSLGARGIRGRPLMSVVDTEQGDFEIRGVPQGSYYIAAVLFDRDRSFTVREPLEVGSTNVDGVSLTLAQGADLEGRVRVEGSPNEKFAGVRVSLQPREDMFAQNTNVPVAADGAFVLRNLPADEYRVSIAGATGDSYLKSARLGSESILESSFVLSKGRAGPLELTLSPAGAQVGGVVLDDDNLPIPGATVVLVPAPRLRNNWGFFKVATTDAAGRYLLRGIAPGEYKLFAWDDVETSAWLDPDFLVPYEDRGEKISLAESAQIAQDLKLARPK